MSKTSRDKGKRGERMLAAELREAFPHLADGIRRGWQSRAGDDDADVIGLEGFWLESKFLARFNTAPLDQAIADSKGRGIPVAVVRANRKKPVAMLRWSDLIALMRAVVSRT